MAITCTVACVPLARKSVNPASVPLPAKFHSKKVVQTSIYTRGAPLVTYGHCSFASKVVSRNEIQPTCSTHLLGNLLLYQCTSTRKGAKGNP
eukprot:6131057-Pyramimonas_sp.AAC.1